MPLKPSKIFKFLAIACLVCLMGVQVIPLGFKVTILSLEATSSAQSATTWDPPLRITKGGTYTGRWQSRDPKTPAVQVLTSEPVIIQNCVIQSAGDGIWSLGQKAQLTVRNCLGLGLNPNIARRQKGRFMDVGNFKQVTMEHNTILSFGNGIRILNYDTATQWKGQQAIVRYNRFKNVDGRLSDGHGGYLKTLEGSGANAVGLNTLRSANIEIAWNQVVNRPYESRVEDLISTFESSGTPTNPIRIHDNYLQGGYAPDPAARLDYTGAMINIGDAPSRSNIGYVHAFQNQIVSFENTGIMISAGHHNEVAHNRIISAQRASDGTLLGGTWRSGLVLWDYYNGGIRYWHHNTMQDNAVNVVDRDGGVATNYLPSVGGTNTVTRTTDPLGRLATRTDELAEYRRWQQKLGTKNIRVGCNHLASC